MAYDIISKNEHWDEITRKLKVDVEDFITESRKELSAIRRTIQDNGFEGGELADQIRESLTESAELIGEEIRKMEMMLPEIQTKIDGYAKVLSILRGI